MNLFLSQLATFDAYSDFSFIAIVLIGKNTEYIAFISLGIMGLTLSSTFFQHCKQLTLSENTDTNYFDFVCNTEIPLVAGLLERWKEIKGIPSKVYASIKRSFFEDLPQFLLAYKYISAQGRYLMLLLSFVSSTVISLTKTLTITKANRINDQIQMKVVIQKLKVREGDVDPELFWINFLK